MNLDNLNLRALANQHGHPSIDSLLDEIHEEENSPERRAERESDERICIIAEIASSPEAASSFLCEWVPAPSAELAKEQPDFKPMTAEEIGERTVQFFAQMAMRGETASLLPAPFFRLWVETVSPLIDHVAKHRSDE